MRINRSLSLRITLKTVLENVNLCIVRSLTSSRICETMKAITSVLDSSRILLSSIRAARRVETSAIAGPYRRSSIKYWILRRQSMHDICDYQSRHTQPRSLLTKYRSEKAPQIHSISIIRFLESFEPHTTECRFVG